jgi:hypothetical protein
MITLKLMFQPAALTMCANMCLGSAEREQKGPISRNRILHPATQVETIRQPNPIDQLEDG